MCRHEMPAAPKRTGQNMQQRRAEEEPNARQGYFV
jgi:hypothetical protein